MENHYVLAAAAAAIEKFGAKAPAAMERRAKAHARAHDSEGEAFWRQVAKAVRKILAHDSQHE